MRGYYKEYDTELTVVKTLSNVEGDENPYAKYAKEAYIGENPKWNMCTRGTIYIAEGITTESNKITVSAKMVYIQQMPKKLKELCVGMPENWKLELQQYLIADVRDEEEKVLYRYYDGIGCVHTFEKYEANDNLYYDKEGVGLTLNTDSNTINDENGNEIKFLNGRLSSMTYARTAASLKVNYNANGYITEILDSRENNDGIKLSYNNGQIQKMWSYSNENVGETKLFGYTAGKFTTITKQVNGASKLQTTYAYDEEGSLQMVINNENNEAVKLYNTATGTAGYNTTKAISEGYMENNAFQERFKVTLEKYKTEPDNPQSVIEAYIKNEKNVGVTYMLNGAAKIIGRYEGNESTGYKTIEKRYGIELPYTASVGNHIGTINGKGKKRVNGSVEFNVPTEAEDKFKDTKYLAVNFYLCHTERANRVFAKVTVNNLIEENIELDKTAGNVWQQVKIAFRRPEERIRTIKVEIYDNNREAVSVEACDFRLIESDYSALYIDGGNIKLKDLTTFSYKNGESQKEYNNQTEQDWYMTAADFMRTLKSKARSSGTYDAYFCEGKKRSKINGQSSVSGEKELAGLLNGEVYTYTITSDGNTEIKETYKFGVNTYTIKTETRISYTDINSHPAKETTETSIEYDYDGKKLTETDASNITTVYTYDEKGNVKEVKIRTAGNEEIKVSEYTTETDGNTKTVGIYNGNSGNKYRYKIPYGVIDKKEGMSYNKNTRRYEATGSTAEYTYDEYNEVPTRIRLNGGAEHEITYSNGRVSGVTDGQVKYSYIETRRKGVESTTFAVYDEKAFNDDEYDGTGEMEMYSHRTENVTSGTNEVETYYGFDNIYVKADWYDEYGRLSTVKTGGNTKVEYIYEDGPESAMAQRISKIEDNYNNLTYSFTYDEARLSKIESAENSIEYKGGQTTHRINGINGMLRGESTQRGKLGKITYAEEISGNWYIIDRYSWEYEYNEYGQLKKRRSQGNGEAQSYTYGYAQTNGRGMPMPVTLNYTRNFPTRTYGYKENLSYDEQGNVTTVQKEYRIDGALQIYGGENKSYEYDGQNRLKKETEVYQGKEYVWEYDYDANGRMTEKRDKTPESQETYKYAYDKLGRVTEEKKTDKNGTTSTRLYYYDQSGNRSSTSEIGGANYFWSAGKQLVQYLKKGTLHYYTYDYAGRLATYKQGNAVTKYYYDGDRLIGENLNGAMIYYYYDEQGVCGAKYNGAYYEYVRNTFGDIIAIIKGTEIICRYEYDAWGVCTINTYGNVDMFAHYNPFRYRGYFYCTEMGLYFLQTRFYDPEIGQFISPDSPEYLDPTVSGGIDLYAYCGNNPVNNIDPTGHSFIGIFLAVLTLTAGITFGGVLSGVGALINAAPNENKKGAFLGGFVSGLITTLGVAAAVATGGVGGAFIALGAGVIGGFVGDAINQKISYGNIDYGQATYSGVVNGLINLVAYVGFTNLGIFEGAKWISRFKEVLSFSHITSAISIYLMTLPIPYYKRKNDLIKDN